MVSHPTNDYHFALRRTGPFAFLCLLSLLTYLFLPLVYFSHFSDLSPTASYENPGPGPAVSVCHSAQLPHDSGNCPICQAASSFQDYGCFSLPQVPDYPSLDRLASFIRPTCSIAPRHLLVSGTRAPPICL